MRYTANGMRYIPYNIRKCRRQKPFFHNKGEAKIGFVKIIYTFFICLNHLKQKNVRL